jgi:hypothetical protein
MLVKNNILLKLISAKSQIKRGKKAANELGNFTDDRYYHGYEEGLNKAIKIVEETNGEEC